MANRHIRLVLKMPDVADLRLTTHSPPQERSARKRQEDPRPSLPPVLAGRAAGGQGQAGGSIRRHRHFEGEFQANNLLPTTEACGTAGPRNSRPPLRHTARRLSHQRVARRAGQPPFQRREQIDELGRFKGAIAPSHVDLHQHAGIH